MAELTKEQQEKIFHWSELVKEIASAKEEEMRVRKELCEELFPEASIGTNHIDLGAGYKLTFVKKETTTIDEAALSALKFPKGVLDNTVVWKPSFSVAGYKKLPEKYQTKLDEALIIRPASPTLTIKTPTGK